MSRDRARAILLALLAAGGLLRFGGLNWDDGHHLHPDERFISMVEEKLAFPKTASEYFDAKRSPLDPYNRGEGSFVYGTLPMVAAKAIGPLFGKRGYDGTYLIGRALSGVFDLLTVWLVYRLARRFTHRRAALFSAALSSFCVLGIQLSHFWAVDTFLATFTAGALLGTTRIAQGKTDYGDYAATGLAIGLAAACKITALALLAPLGVAILVAALRPPARFLPASSFDDRPSLRSARSSTRRFLAALLSDVPRVLVTLVAAVAAVRVFLPHIFLGPSPFSLRLDPRWIDDLKRLTALSSSVAGFPPALQWAGRTILFPLENLVLWGAGVCFGLASLAALVWACVAVVRRRAFDLAPLCAHVLFLLAYHGVTMVKSIRYLYPAYPALAVLTGVTFSRFLRASAFPRLVRAVAVAVVAGTALWAIAFTAIYRRPQSRVAATRWIYAHVPARQHIVNESWDDGLPLPMPGYDPGVYAGPPSLPMFDPDSREKAEILVRALNDADWVAVTSNRVYANVTRVPDVFPMSIAYYRSLFDGRLGFERAADVTSYPSLGPLRIPDDRAEEQFTVYDHPRVLLFRKTKRYSAAEARRILLAALPQTPPTMNDWEKWPRVLRRVSAPVRPDRSAAPAESGPSIEPDESPGSSVGAALAWYLALAAVGAAAMPLAWTLFPRFADRGFGLTRILGLVFATYAMTIALTFHVLVNGRRAAVLCLALVALPSLWIFLRERHDVLRFLRDNRRALVQSEIVFAFGFLLFLGIRSFNPEIYWGEKPMDFSILNILARTRSLPASDPWLSGAPLGYYTFGQEMVVFLTHLTRLSTRFTFNLAFGLLGGTILQGAFSLGRNWGGRIRSGAAAAAMTLLVGNLSGLREWLLRKRALDWDYFWATSRVIKDTINEYPFWSLTFADLHAHVLAIPVFLAVAAAALHLVRTHADPSARPGARVAGAALLGFLGAAQALTNAWDVPLLAGLLAVTGLSVALSAGPWWRGLGRGLVAIAVAAASGYLLARPLWVRTGGAPGIGKNLEPAASGADQLTIFGLFFFLAIAWWLSASSERLASRGGGRAFRALVVAVAAIGLAALAYRLPNAFLACGILLFVAAFFVLPETADDRLALGFLAAAFFLVLFCQRLYIYDRMNTFFKLYLEAWLLLALGTAALVFRRNRRGVIDRWAWPARAAAALLAAAAFFTSATAGRAAVSRHFAPYSGPSLDGLRYLETAHPGEYRAVEWLRRTIEGTPVVLEAQGPSYQDFGRISMLTGLPTVLGWDYHVKQRGNPEAEIEARRQAVRSIYTNPDAARIEPLIKRYRVGYVYVGWLEKKTYPAAGLAKFRADKARFELAYDNPETQIYRVVGGPAQDLLLPMREALPASAAPPAPEDEPEEKPAIAEKANAGEPPFANLREPRGAAVDDQGRVWVADFGHSRLRVYDAAGGFLGGWGGRGGGEYGFKELCGVAIAGDALYVADTWNGRVQAYTLAGVFRASAGELYGPRGIAVAPDGRVWVTDVGNHRVVSYDELLQDRQIVGHKGAGAGEFSSPVGIAAAPNGEIFVADIGNKRIQRLSPEGAYRGEFAFPGWGENVEPHIAVDSNGVIWATDPAANSVVALDATGRLVERIGADDAGNKLQNPTGIAVDRKNRILYVVNSGSASVSRVSLAERRMP